MQYPVPSEPRPSSPNWPVILRLIARWALVIGALYLVIWILGRAGATLTPFIIGLVLAYLLLPIVKRLDHYMPRWASITTVYLVGLVLLELIIVFVAPPAANQFQRLINAIPDLFERGNAFVQQQIAAFNRTASTEVQEQVNQQVANIQAVVQRNATAYAQRVGTFLLNSVIGIFETITFLLGFLVIPFFLFYILLDVNRLPNAINSLLHRNIRDDFWNLWTIIDGVFGRYIRGQITLGLIIGTCSFIGLNALSLFGVDVPYTLLLAIVAGIGELIPVIGPILSAIPAVLIAIFTSDSPVTAGLAVTVLYVLIQQLENQILVPRIVGNTLRLHAAILMALLVIASAVGGLPLVILSAPLAAIGRDVFIYLHRRLREPPLTPELAMDGLVPPSKEEETPQRAKRSRPIASGRS